MKRKFFYILSALLAVCGLLSCEKNHITPTASSSLTIVNAIPGATAIVPNFNSANKLQYYATAQQVAANNFFEFGGHVGDIPLSLSLLTDTTHTIFNSTIHTEPYSINSLFLTGTLAAPDYLFTKDTIATVTDSAVNVRFVNISTGSNPINVDIATNASSPIVINLPYKGASKFQHFLFKTTTPATTYSIEFRDMATNKVLITYSLAASAVIPTKLFKSITLVLKGLPGGTGTNAQAIILVNNY